MSKPRITGDRCQRRVEPPSIRPSEEIELENYGAWQEWLRALTPDEKLALESRGLLAPARPHKRKPARRPDEEEEETGVGTCVHLKSHELDPAEALMGKEDALEALKPRSALAAYEIDETTRRDLVLLGYVLPVVIDAADPRLEASLIALALGIGQRQGITVAALAQRKALPGREVDAVLTLKQRLRKWQRDLDICRASMTLLRLVISPILSSRNPRLEAESIAMAARFGLSGGVSMTVLGEKHGVCKQAISTRVLKWVGALGLALPRDCKTQTDNYVLFNVRREKPRAITL